VSSVRLFGLLLIRGALALNPLCTRQLSRESPTLVSVGFDGSSTITYRKEDRVLRYTTCLLPMDIVFLVVCLMLGCRRGARRRRPSRRSSRRACIARWRWARREAARTCAAAAGPPIRPTQARGPGNSGEILSGKPI
jgi:hypothetical protein